MQAKYNIIDSDFYNFDKTSFIISIIYARIVVTRADRRGRNKAIQPGNRE
jgi:hypothetical protein